MHRKYAAPWTGVLLLALASCGTVSDVSDFLSGGSSMRIEVSVYKGPLANDPTVQWAELKATLAETTNALCLLEQKIFRDRTPASEVDAAKALCSDYAGTGADSYSWLRSTDRSVSEFLNFVNGDVPSPIGRLFQDVVVMYVETQSVLKDSACALGDSTQPALDEVAQEPLLQAEATGTNGSEGSAFAKMTQTQNNPSSKRRQTVVTPGGVSQQTNRFKACIEKVALVAGRLRIKAHYWSTALAVGYPGMRDDRLSIAAFANIGGQYGNQLGARADSLLKQVQGGNRYDLSLAVLLRDTNPADTDNLFSWYKAHAKPLLEDVGADPIGTISGEEARSRIRGLERLFGDIHWSKINTVFASGQGDVTLAFIKDDIGNWNLKSFDQDPSQLVDAYTNVAKQALSVAASAINPGILGGVAADTVVQRIKSAQQLTTVASSIQSGGTTSPPPVTPQFLQGLRAAYIARIDNWMNEAGATKDNAKTVIARILDDYQRTLNNIELAAVMPRDGASGLANNNDTSGIVRAKASANDVVQSPLAAPGATMTPPATKASTTAPVPQMPDIQPSTMFQ